MEFIYNPFGFIRDLLYGVLVSFMPDWLASAILASLASPFFSRSSRL